VRSRVGTATATTPVRRRAELGTARRADQPWGTGPVWGELYADHACPWRTTATCTRPVPNCCLGRTAKAREAYHRALTLVHDDTERRLLERRLAQLDRASVRLGRDGVALELMTEVELCDSTLADPGAAAIRGL
jgi:hypothetical protein